jgi:hypothetical protein
LCQKLSDAGYSLSINSAGGITFAVSGGGIRSIVCSSVAVNDGQWHHAIAECDRSAQTLVVYVDGKKGITTRGIDGSVSLANAADLYVGGTPEGDWFHGTFDFLRISLGTLADAKTDIDELYAWQFDGPFLRDFAGHNPQGKRDAGALEKMD